MASGYGKVGCQNDLLVDPFDYFLFQPEGDVAVVECPLTGSLDRSLMSYFLFQPKRDAAVVECPFTVRWVVGSIPHELFLVPARGRCSCGRVSTQCAMGCWIDPS